MASVTGSVIQVDEEQIRSHVDEVVRSSVEATLNGLLDAEAAQLCRAKRYERSAERVDTRAGSYERKLTTKAGEVTLKVPRLRSLSYMHFPHEHWTRIRTNNPLERIMHEIRRRTRVVGAFPDGKSALMLVAARLRHVAGTRWGTRKYLDMNWLAESNREEAQGAVA